MIINSLFRFENKFSVLIRGNSAMKCESKIVARYAETDQMGIVHHSVYPIWFEVGRTDFIKLTGMSYTELEESGVMLPLASLECKYILPIKYEDEVIIETTIVSVKAAKIEFQYRVLRGNQVCSEGGTVHAFVYSKTFRPINIKKINPSLYEKFCAAVAK